MISHLTISLLTDIVSYLIVRMYQNCMHRARGGRTMTTSRYRVLAKDEGLILKSGPGRDLTFKVTGDDSGGAFDYFVVGVAPHGGPPLHVHHLQEETIHVLKGRFKIRIGDELFYCAEGGFAYLPSKVPHAFLNLTDEPGEIIVVYTPGGG